MPKHIIDKNNPEFGYVPATLNGEILLEVDRYENGNIKGFITIPKEDLCKKMKDRFNDLSEVPSEFHNMTFLAYIKADVDDKTGHKKYMQIFKEAATENKELEKAARETGLI